MNREEYINYLERENGYCKCQALDELFKKRRNAETLERKCESYGESVDLKNPRQADALSLSVYKKSVEDFRKAVSDYYVSLNQFLQEKKLNAKHHKLFFNTEDVSLEQVNELRKKSAIITIHCSVCDKQIDIID